MALSDWNWRYPVELQDVPWDCAAASTAWALHTIGYPQTEADVVAGLGPSRISPSYGLLDASGAGLVSYLGEIGVTALHNPDASWDNLMDAAGYQPMVIGGRAWYHWVGVRIGNDIPPRYANSKLALANPSPGWDGVHQILDPYDFSRLGAFSAVWFTSW
jgi:hypothetical protein